MIIMNRDESIKYYQKCKILKTYTATEVWFTIAEKILGSSQSSALSVFGLFWKKLKKYIC